MVVLISSEAGSLVLWDRETDRLKGVLGATGRPVAVGGLHP